MKLCHVLVVDKKIEIMCLLKILKNFTEFIPYLDDLFCSLKQRFLSHKDTIKSLQYVLPSLTVDKPFSCLKPAVQFY
jgi:hypothetical protein